MANWSSGGGYMLAPEYNVISSGSGPYDPRSSYLAPQGQYTGTMASTGYSPYQGNGGNVNWTASNGLAAAGVGLGSYQNATTNSTGSTANGAIGGAMAGYQATGSGYGAVIGGVIGAMSGWFGSKSKKKDDKKEFGRQLDLSVANEKAKYENYQKQQTATTAAMSQYGSAYNPSGGFSGFLAPREGGPASSYAPGVRAPIAPSSLHVEFATEPKKPGYSKNKTEQQLRATQYRNDYNYYLEDQIRQQQAAAMGAYGNGG